MQESSHFMYQNFLGPAYIFYPPLIFISFHSRGREHSFVPIIVQAPFVNHNPLILSLTTQNIRMTSHWENKRSRNWLHPKQLEGMDLAISFYILVGHSFLSLFTRFISNYVEKLQLLSKKLYSVWTTQNLHKTSRNP